MKFLFSWVLVLAILLESGFAVLGQETAPLQNVQVSLSNSGFESWQFNKFSNWSFDGTSASKSIASTTDRRSGSRAALLSKGAAGYSMLSSSAVSVTSGCMYSFGVYVKTANAQNCRSYVMLSEQNSSGQSLYYNFSETVYGNISGYTLLTGTVYIPSGISRVVLSIVLADADAYVSTDTSYLYADDAFLKRHTPSVMGNTQNFDFEQAVTENGTAYPTGWTVRQTESGGITEAPPSVRCDGTYYHSGSKSLYFGKSGAESLMYLESAATFDVDESYCFSWGGWYKSAESNALLRIDLLVYDQNGTQIATLTGNTKMLSHDTAFHDWTVLSTTAQMPTSAKKASFCAVFTAGRTCVYLDDLFCTPTENYYEKQVESCDFHAVTETGRVEGWTASGSLSAHNRILSWHAANDTLSHETTAFVPHYGYEISVDYTATASGEMTLTGYDASGKSVDSKTVNFAASEVQKTLSVPFVGFDAVKTVVSFAGTGDYTFSNYIVYETSSPSEESGWTANWLWYPENATTDAIWQFRYFRTHIYLDHSGTISSAKLCVAADDNVSLLYVNGTSVSIPFTGTTTYTEDGKRTVRTTNNLSAYLKQGDNILAFRVFNCTSKAGLLFEGDVRYTDGTVRHIASGITDETVTSRLNCTQSHADDYSSFAENPSDWYKTSFDDSGWIAAEKLGIPPYGGLGAVSSYFNPDAVYSFRLSSAPTVSVAADTEFSFSATFSSAQNAAFMPSTVTGKLYRGENCVATLPISCSFRGSTATFAGKVPDYLSGTYSLRIQKSDLYLKNRTENDVAALNVSACNRSAASASVETENGAVRLKINGMVTPPVMYLAPHYKSYYDYNRLSGIQSSGMSVYCSYNCLFDGSDGMDIWTGNDAGGNPVLNFALFDYQICRMLDLNPNAYLLVNVGMDAPEWWKAANPDELMRDSNGNTINAVSFASTLYRTQAQKALAQVVDRLKTAPYKHRIVGVRLVAGRTFEWMLDGIENGAAVDYSAPAQTGFRAFLKNKYGTDSTLRTVWNNSGVTLSSAAIPSVSQRSASGVLLDPQTARNVIDFNAYLSQMTADSLLAYAQTVKSTAPDLLVGAYYGYLWNFGSAEAIGSAHTACAQVLESPNIDFIASPVNYSERLDGYDTGYMTASESVSAHGKLYLVEQDNRTIYGEVFRSAERDNPVGLCNTLNDSVNQITRDSVKNFVKGKGMWYYDMSGGWFSDASILERISAIRTEYEVAARTNIASNAQVAVFVGEMTYNYFCNDQISGSSQKTASVLQTLYAEQRKALSQMGADYDVYTVEDLCKGIVRDYKLNIVLSPFELTDAQRTAIDRQLKTAGKTVLWVYLPGIIDGASLSATNLSDLIDMSVSVQKVYGKNLAIAEETNGMISAGTAGATYGNADILSAYFAAITDSSAEVLARYPNKSVAAAYKNVGDYTSVYSAVPGVSADLLITLCEYAGVHRYSQNRDDIIHTNNGYLSIYSMTAGTKTVDLDAPKRVYDVFRGEYLPESQQISVDVSAGETALFRFEAPAHEYDGGIIQNGDFYQVGNTDTGHAFWNLSALSTENPNLALNGSFENGLD
ncbi:MAG: carbohydrate binding domain-containing protein, partial [Clostridia bacterium]|nr:carbohydrate binding domain-containing protein [Clostridia bacterium]